MKEEEQQGRAAATWGMRCDAMRGESAMPHGLTHRRQLPTTMEMRLQKETRRRTHRVT